MGSCEGNADETSIIYQRTSEDVIHAEVAAIKDMEGKNNVGDEIILYVSYPPCANCSANIEQSGIEKVVIVDSFMKFDAKKLHFELVPICVYQTLPIAIHKLITDSDSKLHKASRPQLVE